MRGWNIGSATAVAALLLGSGCGSGGDAGSSSSGTSGSVNGASTGAASSTGGTSAASSSSGTTAGATTGASSGSAGAASGTSGGTSASCVGPGYGGGEAQVAGASVTATLVDQDGAPVPNQPLFICGIDICSPPATTNASGDASISTNLTERRPTFRFGDALHYALFAVPLADSAPTALGTLATAKLPATGAAITAGADATSGEVTLTVAAGAQVEVDTLTYASPSDQQFRAAAVPLAQAGPIVAPALVNGQSANFGLLYGVSPADTLFCPPAAITVQLPHQTASPNDLGWAPGAAVEFWITSTDVSQAFAPFGGWAKVSDGAVSPDGASVSTSPGQGLPVLMPFAVRLKT